MTSMSEIVEWMIQQSQDRLLKDEALAFVHFLPEKGLRWEAYDGVIPPNPSIAVIDDELHRPGYVTQRVGFLPADYVAWVHQQPSS